MLRILRPVIVVTWVSALIVWELKRGLRPIHESKLRRDARNLAIAVTAGAVMQFVEVPVAFRVANWITARNYNLVSLLPTSSILRGLIAILLLDYTLYVWHVLTHRVPFLWRFHQAHHIDREMDASTALRFHFGEIAISVGFRAAQVFLIGPSATAIAAWQLFLFCSILFHHSNVRLPLAWERRIARLVMTPRLHGIHHSIAPEQVNSNWSSGLTIWDWLHGTLRTGVPQQEIVIGVHGHLSDADQTLASVMLVPFRGRAEIPPMPEHSLREPIARLQP